jgi:hypothetical protein
MSTSDRCVTGHSDGDERRPRSETHHPRVGLPDRVSAPWSSQGRRR